MSAFMRTWNRPSVLLCLPKWVGAILSIAMGISSIIILFPALSMSVLLRKIIALLMRIILLSALGRVLPILLGRRFTAPIL